jgi:hypothetical protein
VGASFSVQSDLAVMYSSAPESLSESIGPWLKCDQMGRWWTGRSERRAHTRTSEVATNKGGSSLTNVRSRLPLRLTG